ncbi:MAG: TRAP transporter large permease subunit [Acidiferrobacterales bacterium]|nr:TRAP transporter large permease subunit [Acidiferrobacterales bacterium]
MIALIAIVLVVLALLGVPLFVLVGAGALVGYYSSGIDLQAFATEIYRLAEMPVLSAIPLFTFAGYLLGESQAPQRLVRLTDAAIGWMPGGLAVVALLACAMFTAFTGASGVTIVALGALLYPALKQAHYPENFNLGLITSSGSLGLLFAPSVPLILYGIIAQQQEAAHNLSISDMFLAGILPGLLMVVLLVFWSFSVSRNIDREIQAFSWKQLANAVRESGWELPLPVAVLGGVYSGYFAVSEVAAVTALYVLIVEVFIRKEISLKQLPSVMRESMVLVGAILIILGASLASTNYFIDAQIPSKLFNFIHAHVDSKLTFLVLLNIFLLVLGAMLDIFSAIVLMVPLILPVAIAYGVHPVHLGIIFLANMQIGYFTPPVGMNLFIASYRFDQPVSVLYRATLPFFFILLFAVLIITYWPELSLVFISSHP